MKETVRELHDLAMSRCFTLFARAHGYHTPMDDTITDGQLLQEAADYEYRAWRLVPVEDSRTYGVMAYSAAWCAYKAGQYDSVREIVADALAVTTLQYPREQLQKALAACPKGG